MTVRPTGNKEESAQYYDEVYSRVGGYPTDRFSPIYDCVMRLLSDRPDAKIFECGCGVGVLAEMIIRYGYEYHGFDFSGRAIRSCPHIVTPFVDRDDAYDKLTWIVYEFDTVISIETFEHIQDLKVLEFVPKGTRVIFSVPNFNSKSHLRTYHSVEGIKEYYKDSLVITETTKIRTSKEKYITVCDAIKL